MKKQHLIILALTTLLLLPTTSWAAVTLKYFRAETPNDSTVHLVWETATELDHAAFILSRAITGSNQYQELSTFPAKGDAVSGATYEYDDTSITQGQSYSYKLEELDNDGNVSLAQQPITVVVGSHEATSGDATATPQLTTPTPESTPNQEITNTPTIGNTPNANSNHTNQNNQSNTPAANATPETEVSITETAAPSENTTNNSSSATPTATPETIANNAPITFPTPTGAKHPLDTPSGASNILLYLGLAALTAAAVLGLIVLRIWRSQSKG